jgi:hypothetical protein
MGLSRHWVKSPTTITLIALGALKVNVWLTRAVFSFIMLCHVFPFADSFQG